MDRLLVQVRGALGREPEEGEAFVFANRIRRDQGTVRGGDTAAAQSAATAIWNFIAGDAPVPAQPLFGDGFEGGSAASGRWVMGYYVG